MLTAHANYSRIIFNLLAYPFATSENRTNVQNSMFANDLVSPLIFAFLVIANYHLK